MSSNVACLSECPVLIACWLTIGPAVPVPRSDPTAARIAGTARAAILLASDPNTDSLDEAGAATACVHRSMRVSRGRGERWGCCPGFASAAMSAGPRACDTSSSPDMSLDELTGDAERGCPACTPAPSVLVTAAA
jgi:hypothetical protein